MNDTNANKATVFCKYRNSEYQADKNNVQTQKHQERFRIFLEGILKDLF